MSGTGRSEQISVKATDVFASIEGQISARMNSKTISVS